MATINTSWTTVDSYTWTASSGFSVTFYLDARYSASDKQSIENNGSNIYTRLRSVINQGSGSGSGYSFNCSFCETISGSSVWYLTTETILESAKTFVEHEADGTKKITLTAGGSINYIGLSFSLSAEVVLDTIPRTTKLSAQTATIGTALKIAWTKASSAFTHKLTYTFGDSTDVVIGTDLVDSVTWTPSTSLYEEIPDDPSGKGTLTLTTYNGATIVGSSTADLTIYAKESACRPKISSGSVVDTNSTTINLTGDSSVIVIGQSAGKLSLKFVTQYYATAKTLKVNNVSQSFTLSTSSSGTYTYTATITYNNVKTNSFKVEVTDSRDFTNSSYTVTTEKVDYIPLNTNVKFKRIQPTTGEVGVIFNGDYFNQSFGSVSNTLAITYKYKVRNSDTYSDIKTFALNTDYVISENTYYSGTSSSESVIQLSDTFDYKSSFEGIMYIEDQLQVLAVNFIIVKGIPILWWNGEKVTINGDLYVADENGENAEKVNVSGNVSKNLFNSVMESGKYSTTGTKTTDSTTVRNAVPIKVEPSTEYIFSNNGSSIGMNVFEYDGNGSFIKYYNVSSGSSFQTTNTTEYINFYKGNSNYDAIQLEKGTIITEYEEYYEPTISIRNSNDVFQEVVNIDYIKNKIEKSSILINLSDVTKMTFSTAWNYVIVPLNNIVNSSGDKFTYTDNSIKIGKNVSKIKITASFNWYNYENVGDKAVSIFKNGTPVRDITYGSYPSDVYYCSIVGFDIMDVTEGDLISLQAASGGAGSCNLFTHTSMLIEEL